MKRIFQPLFLLLALLLPTIATAYDFEVDGIYYNKNGNEASVTFKDTQYNSYKDTVNIPKTVTYLDTTYTVTHVGSRAFEKCSDLRRVTFPNTITEIEYRGFYNCTLLSNISFPSSLRVIGTSAFENCKRISSPSLSGVTTIGSSAFANTDYWILTLPASVTSVASDAFAYCNLFKIYVASNNPVYDSRGNCNAIIEKATNTLIMGCGHTVVPNTVTTIGASSFVGCTDLTDLNLPNSVTTIGSWAFLDCSNLRNVTIPNSVTTIKNSAFCYCKSLDHVVIPFSVTELGVGAFYGCSALTSITIPYTITAIGSSTFAECYGLESITIPNSVTSIGDRAFKLCYNLKEINIPNTVTYLGEDAFLDCRKLKEIVMPNSVTTIGKNIFYGCTSLERATLSENITEIPQWAFAQCFALSSVNLPEGLTSIGFYAFGECESLTSLTIPSTVTSIGGSAFSQSGLNTYIYNAVNCTSIGNNVMANMYVDNYQIGEGVEYIPAYMVSFNLGDRIITMPNSVKVIQANAFKNSSAAAVVIGNKIEEIGAGAFSNKVNVAYATSAQPRPCSPGAFVKPDTLYVPAGSRARYLAAEGWNEFETIIEGGYIRATGITLDNDEITLAKGATQQLNATVLPNDATSQIISWGSENATVATVTENGLVTAVSTGETDIIAMIDNVKAICHVVVPPTLAEGLTLNHDHLSMTIGETASLVATISPEITDNRYIEWVVPDNGVLMTQESNDNTLDIAALHKGRVTITARTTDGSNMSATCVVTVLDAGGEDAFYVSDMSALHGDTIVLPVAMSSTEPIYAFQTDIYLPDGFTIVTDNDDEYMITPSSRMTNDHVMMTNDMGNGVVSVVCYSPNEYTFVGNDGDDLFYIAVAVPDDATGTYTIQLKNSLLTTNLFQELSIPDVSANIEVKAFLPGDANDSRTVTVTDIVVSAQYILQLNPSPFIFEAADMSGDGNITVTDIMMIANLIKNPRMNAPHHAPAIMTNHDCMSGEDITIAAGETRRVSIALDNEMDYSAFQLDLQLPAGLQASNFALTDRAGNHAFDVNTLEDGSVRALCFSPDIEAIEGNSGALLTFDVTATGNVSGDITVDGIELVTTACQTVLVDGFVISVNASSAVNELASGKTVVSTSYYNLAGRQISQPVSGVNIVVTTHSDGTSTTSKMILK